MVRILLLTLILLPSFVSVAQITREIKTLDSALVQLNAQAMFNGVALVAEKGKIVYQKNFGVASIETGAPLSVTSSFNMASVTKQFITMMVMMLKEQKKLSYDDPVVRHIPGFPYGQITLRHLMTHTSGLPEYFDLALRYSGPMDTITNATILKLITDIKPALVYPTGSKWEYCNTGYALLANVIENITEGYDSEPRLWLSPRERKEYS